jgi:hypothetical protein
MRIIINNDKTVFVTADTYVGDKSMCSISNDLIVVMMFFA